MAFAFIVDKVVGEELSEPILEAKLDVILEVILDAKGFTTENTELCVWKINVKVIVRNSFRNTETTRQFLS